MTWFRKIKAGLVKAPIENHTGAIPGELFFNIETGELYLTDGKTPGGIPLGSSTGDVTSTDQLKEGTKNLFFTDDRVADFLQNNAVDASSLEGKQASAFATFDQGLLADSALQPGSDVSLLNNDAGYITFSDISVSGDLEYDAETGELSVVSYSSDDFDLDFDQKTTDHLNEGTVNLYFSDHRVDARVADTSISALLDVDSDLIVNLEEDSILIYNSAGNHFVAESFLSILDRLRAELEVMYDKLVDEDGTITYIGEAEPGSSRSDNVWRIKRVEEINNDIEILWAEGSAAFDKNWENRKNYQF